ncbi:MAG: trypsin-like peptidase domain-containing protein [Clostridia bacterium]|nr:trypsin-like peptidase domain-containing protein [Clostridia bacterium]
MDNNQEKQDEIFNMNDSQNNGFKKVTAADSSFKTQSQYVKSSKGNSIFIPFASGIIGATLVIGTCFGVPQIKEKLIGETNIKTTTSISKSSGSVSNSIDSSDYSGTAISVAKKVLPSVVGIEVQFSVTTNSPFSLYQSSGTSKAGGSGVIITEDGYILTNNHIVDTSSSSSSFYTLSSAEKVLVYLYEEDEPIEAKIVGTDSVTDLAILKIDRDDLTPAELGDSDSIKIGEFAMAIGNPLNMPYTVTSGIISGLNREITDSDGTSYKLVQTDAAINSGNSGGALVNADGKVIGINTLKLYGTGIEGMGFAIPINSTIDITDELISHGKVKRPYIGISGSDVSESYAKYYDIPQGVYVSKIENDGSAKDSELQAGDIITEVNGKKVTSMNELNKIKYDCEVGETIELTVYRYSDNKSTHKIKIKLVEQP